MLYIPLLFIYSTTSRKEIEGLVITNLKKKKQKTGPENFSCQSIKKWIWKKPKPNQTLLKNLGNNFIWAPDLALSFLAVEVEKKMWRSQDLIKRKQISSLDKKIFFLSLDLRGPL